MEQTKYSLVFSLHHWQFVTAEAAIIWTCLIRCLDMMLQKCWDKNAYLKLLL